MTESTIKLTTLSSYLRRQHKDFKPKSFMDKSESTSEPTTKLTTLPSYLDRQRKKAELH